MTAACPKSPNTAIPQSSNALRSAHLVAHDPSATVAPSASSINRKTAPSGLFGATHNRPSWASMIERQIDRPIPIPPDFVVNSGLNIRSKSCEPIPVPVSATDTITPPPLWTSDLTHRTRAPSLPAIESIAFVIQHPGSCRRMQHPPETRMRAYWFIVLKRCKLHTSASYPACPTEFEMHENAI